MAGLLILIIDRGIIKVALARGRFQLRISVSLGTIGSVGSGRKGKGREEGERPGREIGDEWLRRVLYLLSVLLILYLLPQEDKPWVNNVRGFFQLILRNRRSLGIICEINSVTYVVASTRNYDV